MGHTEYMQQAIQLAEMGCGFVNPNPMVGAIIVKGTRVIGKGYHQKAGGLHAERNAINDCSESLKGTTMYVTLEPCCHYGRTPPCTDAIIQSEIRTVVIGMADPNPVVGGKGIKILREHGIEVITGVLEEECGRQNKPFLHHIQTKTPFVAMKYAMTADGKIATSAGNSKWITGETAKKHVHQLRHRYTGIMVGVNTVIADDPMLNCRLSGTLDPTRIICDTNLRIPIDSQVVKTANEITTMVAYCSGQTDKRRELELRGCHLIKVPADEGKTDLRYLMKGLYEMGIDSVLLEGGSTLNSQALHKGIVQKIYEYIAPKLVGGDTARGPIGGTGIGQLTDAVKLVLQDIQRFDQDLLLEYEVEG